MTKRGTGAAAAALAAVGLLSPLVFGAAGDARDTKPGDRVPFSLALRAAPPDPGPAPPRFNAAAVLAGPRQAKPEAVSPVSGPPQKPKAHVGRAWLELGAFLAYSTASYWIRNGFPEDWQYHLTLDSQIPRFFWFEGWRFDSNMFRVNWTHTMAGGIYYQFARTNNLSWASSWLISIAVSTYWEGFTEWREVISLNDQMLTGVSSYAIGESWYQLGYFLGNHPSTAVKVLAWFFNPPLMFNRWLDRKDPATRSYVPPGWRDFRLFAGARNLSSSGQASQTAAYIGLHTQIIELADYGKPGEFDEGVKDTYFSEIGGDYSIRNGHADETSFTLGAAALGHFRQKINDAREGYSLTIGMGSSFEYFKKKPVDYYDSPGVPYDFENPGSNLELDQPRNFTDKLAILHVAGPRLDWTIFRHGLRLRTVAGAYFDFGLINSLALNAYSELHHTPSDDTIEGMKSTVLYYGYYYGFGGTLSVNSRLEWGNFRVQGLASFGAWGSADFRDRFPEHVTNNAHLNDSRTRGLLGVGWKLPGVPLELFADIEGFWRYGHLAEVSTRYFEKKAYTGLAFIF
jgi:hypothetical protein